MPNPSSYDRQLAQGGKRQLELGERPATDLQRHFEDWVLHRLQTPRLFDDCGDLPDARRARVGALLVTRDLEFAVAGKLGTPKTETYGEAFKRIYGVSLYQHGMDKP